MIKLAILILTGLAVAAVVVWQPLWLSDNVFLRSFVGADLLSLMAVVLTVTLASVANIHIALNRIVGRSGDKRAKLEPAARAVKSEVNDDAWYIFWGFVAAVGILVTKGAAPLNIDAQSAMNGLALWVLVLYMVCLYDIYRVVFGVVNLDAGDRTFE